MRQEELKQRVQERIGSRGKKSAAAARKAIAAELLKRVQRPAREQGASRAALALEQAMPGHQKMARLAQMSAMNGGPLKPIKK